MKGFVFFGLLVGMLGCSATAGSRVDVSVSAHFSDLDGYGDWIYVAGYGTVWKPYASAEWRPFTYGHWVYSSDGWLWVSDEPFGWVVCHYGNWYYDDDLGWMWIPGYDWSPARVEWHVTDYEVGWSPLFPPAPPGHARVHVRTHAHWMFVPVASFTHVDVRSRVTVRTRPSASAKVVVRRRPPRIEVVQRHVKRPIVRVTPKKVKVTSRERPLVRVEVSGARRAPVVVPVGPKYRKVTVKSKPASKKVIVKSKPAPKAVTVKSKKRRGTAKITVGTQVRERDDDKNEVTVKKKKVKVRTE